MYGGAYRQFVSYAMESVLKIFPVFVDGNDYEQWKKNESINMVENY